MRFFEWLTAAAVVLVAWRWFRGRRAGMGLALLGLAFAGASALLEGPRVPMVPAYLIAVIALTTALLSRVPAAPPRRGAVRTAARAAGALLVVLLGAVCPWLWPVIKLPTPSGPNPIGVAWLVVRDSTRHERFTSVRGAMREFPVKIWYPAATGATGPMAPYALPEEMTALGLIPRFLAAQVRLVKTHGILGAPVAEGKAPVLIFSHGYTGYAAQNTPQMEELASRGYVVASIAHPGEAAWAPFPGGRGVPVDSSVMNSMRRQMAQAKKTGAASAKSLDSTLATLNVPDPKARLANFRAFLNNTPEPLRSQSVMQWALDTKALLDVLGNMNAGVAPSPFKDRLDLGHVGVFGMSYGGATAGEFCRLDHRCMAAINIDGGQYGGLIDDSLRVPLLIIASEQAYGIHLPVLDLARGPAYLIRVPATNHIGLTDLTLQGPLFGWFGVTGRLDPDRREAIMTDYTVAFFERYLMGRSPEAFDRLAEKYPEVQMTTRNHP